ncbi:WD40 repeat domain-containing protein [Thalassoroseus pseudoceratinae]|uniref:WD40 repeat domain-containing protein n=1 Tax=Thalassoroseus pseudoceratinae TaxID=2713176 RepID=UPI001421E421|nr:hypothetical protein [Thalassoroseus pseudoceratinae]
MGQLARMLIGFAFVIASPKVFAEEPSEVLRQIGGANQPSESRPQSVRGLAISEVAGIVATYGEPSDPNQPRVIQLWNTQTGRLQATLPGPDEPIRAMAVTSDGKTLVTTSFDVTTQTGLTQIWDTDAGQLRHLIPEGAERLRLHDDGTVTLAVPGQLRVYRLQTGEEIRRFLAPNLVRDISVDGTQVLTVTSTRDPVLRIFNVTNQTETAKLTGCTRGPRTARFSSDGRTVAAIDGGRLLIWEVETGRIAHELIAGNTRLVSMEFSSDDRFLLAGGLDRRLHVWEVATGEKIFSAAAHTGQRTAVSAVAVGSRNNRVVTGGTDRKLIVWDAGRFLESRLASSVLTDADLTELWQSLAGGSGSAMQAMGQIRETPEQCLGFLRDRVAEVTLPAQKAHIRELLVQLGHSKSAIRHQAMQELIQLRAVARPLLLETYETTDSAEVRYRLSRVLSYSEDAPRFTNDDILRMKRLVTALAPIDAQMRSEILQALAADFPDEAVKSAAETLLK